MRPKQELELAPRHHRGLPADERDRPEPGHLGQHQRALRRPHADHAVAACPTSELAPEDIAAMPLEGEYGSWDGPLAPSTEWRFHLDITRARPEVGAIVHAHSHLRDDARDLPQGDPGLPLHDRGRGRAEHPLRRLRHLRHQGALGRGAGGARGPHLLPARQPRHDRHRRRTSPRRCGSRSSSRPSPGSTTLALRIGGPVLLPDAEIAKVKERFKSYGPRPEGRAANGKKAHRRAKRHDDRG